jgi:competence protein ComEA
MKLLNTLLLIVTLALMTATAPAQTSGGAAKSQAKTAVQQKTTAPAAGALVDINSASAADLKALAGIGDVYSAKIIAGRPYANKSQLVSRKIIPQATYDKIKDKVVARQSK